ncbi:MAG: M1 family metallopeptidase [Chitinophagaceae bacterium]
MKYTALFVLLFVCKDCLFAQPDRWQQKVKYTMVIDMDVNIHRLTGKQKLEYTNNSPDTLHTVFYHLYFNAFQPNSMMDARSRELGKIVLGKDKEGKTVIDWDKRVSDRIQNLKPDEIGYQKILSLKMNGAVQSYKVKETILEVKLSQPVLPRSKVVFDMDFEAQVPLQVRRSGRDNPKTGVKYSMSQWYPKLCEYDYEGWHPTPYIAREFYGIWGDFDVKISIDKNFVLGGTGYLQNASQIGYNYEMPGTKVVRNSGNKLTWHFLAPNVHDFMWAADAQYQHIVRKASKGTLIHVLYNRDQAFLQEQLNALSNTAKAAFNNDFKKYLENVDSQWTKVADAAVVVLPFIEKHFGEYPYQQYSFIQGGDGGMEYPMATLISGSGLGTAFHEWMHSWFQMILATNESLYSWMDEGFTSYAETLVMEYYNQQSGSKPAQGQQGASPRPQSLDSLALVNPHDSAYYRYFNLAMSGFEEPMTTHADHFNTNYAYSIASYSKGQVFMEQLGYITGAAVRDSILLEYYRLWRFKHPNVNDFMRVAEKISNMKLDWYREYWVNTTKLINYGIDSLWEENGKTKIRLKNNGEMPMPVDLQLTFNDGSKELHYIPMYLMFGEKPIEFPSVPRMVHEAWKWTHPTYIIEINRKAGDLSGIEIDPTKRMADIDRRDNKVTL